MLDFERFDDEDGKPRVRIKGGNREILFTSEAYESEDSREHVIDVLVNSIKNDNYVITTKDA